MFRVILVSDTHIGVRTEHFRSNWQVVRRWIEDEAPDLVINTGDFSLDGADDIEDLELALEYHRALPCPVLAVPGNHDIGDHPRLSTGRQVIDPQRHARYRDTAGADYWLHDIGGWRLIGLNVLLIGSGLLAEAAQSDWLRQAVAGAEGRRLAVFQHKPLFVDRPDETKLTYWTVDPALRDQYIWLLDHPDFRLLASGHLHQYRLETHGRAKVLWAPSVAFVVGDTLQPEALGGLRETGVVDLRFGADDVEIDLVRLPDLDNTVIDEIIHTIYPPVGK